VSTDPNRLHGDAGVRLADALPTVVTISGLSTAALAELVAGAPMWLVYLVVAMTAAMTVLAVVLVERERAGAEPEVIDLRPQHEQRPHLVERDDAGEVSR
jgi:hypothetical protein